jgi:Ca2+-transporting ATPase
MLGVAALLATTLALPFARHLFGFGPLHPDDLAVVLAVGLLTILLLDAVKPYWRRRFVS